MKRYERLWNTWDEEIHRGTTPKDFLETLTDEQLVGMLSTARDIGQSTRRYERNLILTEALNRMVRTRRSRAALARGAAEFARDVRQQADHSAALVHQTEGVVEMLAGDEEDRTAEEVERVRVAHDASARIEEVRAAALEAERRARELEASEAEAGERPPRE